MKRGKNKLILINSPLTKNKIGLSTIVITLIITVLSLVAVGIVWVVVRNVLSSGSHDVGIEQFTMKLDITHAYENSGTINVVVKRGSGEGTLTKIKFVLIAGDNSEIITVDSSLEELQSDTFILTPSELSSLSISTVSVVPVVQLSDGTQKILDITDTYYLSGSPDGEAGEETADCTPACSGGTPHCLGGECFECLSNEDCSGADICTAEHDCYPIETDCTPACGLRICGPDPLCGEPCGICVTGTCSADGLSCISCTPNTCLSLGYDCGTQSDGCGGTLECGTCLEGNYCDSGICREPILINEGTVSESWPGTSGMYFGSPDLPTVYGIVSAGNYVSYSGGTDCYGIALFRTAPEEGYDYSHVMFNFETSIAAGDHYQIWPSSDQCLAII